MSDPLRLNGYVMLGDLAWITESLPSYSGILDRLVVSHDRTRRSWTGEDLSRQIERGRELIGELELGIDVQWLEGDFVAPDEDLMAAETRQRQASLDLAGADADWVVQLDTDEVVPNLAAFARAIRDADAEGFQGLEYSARWLHTHVRGRWFTEVSTRRLRFWDGIAGPAAVRAGTRLKHARQTDARSKRLTVASGSDGRIPLDDAILHFSWVRTRDAIQRKSRISGHASDFDWEPKLRQWSELCERPIRGVVRSVLDPAAVDGRSYRFARLPKRYSDDLVEQQISLGLSRD